MSEEAATSHSTSEAADVTVIVPVRNDAERLARCVDAIRRSAHRAKIIVVDDASTEPVACNGSDVTLLRLEGQAGPAVGRNRGARLASSPILFFVDADVLIHPDAVGRVSRTLGEGTGIDAVFGSYDLAPASPNFCSQYKNLFHRYVHQQASAEASTFWSGCGAIRRETFVAHGGFSSSYERPCIEDIELGMRLRRAGHRIVLDKQLQATHLKAWTIASIVRSDVFDRAIPWSRLLVQSRSAPNDLNVSRLQRASAMIACLAIAMICIGAIFRPILLALPIAAIGAVAIADRWPASWRSTTFSVPALAIALTAASGIALYQSGSWGIPAAALLLALVLLNAHFYRYWLRTRGIAFAALVLPMHVLYFAYSTAALAWVMLTNMPKSKPTPRAEARSA